MAGRPLGMKSLMNALSRFSHAQLQKIIAAIPSKSAVVTKLERQREKLVGALAKLDRKLAKLSGEGNGSAPAAPAGARRRKFSAATRRKMAESQRLRWAKKNGGQAAPAAASKPRRTLSPETRAKMAEAARRRWAKVKGTPEQPTT